MNTSDSAPVDVLSRALDQTHRVLDQIGEDELSRPTPCGDWDLAHLIAHVVQSPSNFAMMADGEQPDWSAAPPELVPDWSGAFRSAADHLLETVQRSAEGPPPDWQTAEFAMHSWDLARATRQSEDLDPEVAQRGLDFMTASLTPDMRGGAFGPEQPVPEGGSVYDRLAAFAGRDPSWQPA